MPVRLLQIWLSLLLFVPALLTFAPLGAAGSPASLFGVAMAAALLVESISRTSGTKRPNSWIAKAAALLAVAILISYVSAAMRPINPQELTTADRGLVTLACLLGVFFTASWGLSTFADLEKTLVWSAYGIAAVSLVGVAQFATRQTIVDRISLPGLTPNAEFIGVIERAGYSRVAGTATHPIEFGVLLAMGLPLALYYAFYGQPARRAWRWFPLAAITLGLPLSLSRSAVICVIAVLVVLIPTWPRERAIATIVAIGGVTTAIYVTLPGLLGPFLEMFNLSADASARSRTDSYGYALELFLRAPAFGRGFLTLLPRYRILDNQYAGTAIELGLFGLIALALVLLLGIITPLRAAARLESQRSAALGRSAAAAVAAAALSYATFDAFAFPQVSEMLFFFLGACSAFERVARRAEPFSSTSLKAATYDV